MPEKPTSDQDDPVVHSSLSVPLLLSTLVLFLTLVWAVVDETYLMRPWKQFQTRFVQRYSAFLKTLQPVQGQSEETIRKSAAYQQLAKAVDDARKASAAGVERINKELSTSVQPRLADITKSFQTVRSHIAALTYDMETSESERSKQSLRKDIEELRQTKEDLRLTKVDGSGQKEAVKLDFDQMEREYNRLKDRRAQLQGELIRTTAAEKVAQEKLAAYVKDQLTGLTR